MKKILFWTVAVLITVGAAMYQRMTGPTYPDRVKVTIEGSEYEYKPEEKPDEHAPVQHRYRDPG